MKLSLVILLTLTAATAAAAPRDPTRLPWRPLLLSRAAVPKSPAHFRGQVWVLSGLETAADRRHPLARHDGRRWDLFSQPFHYPKWLVADGEGLLVSGDGGVVVRRPHEPWRKIAPPTKQKQGWRWRITYAGGAAIVAFTRHRVWRWSWSTSRWQELRARALQRRTPSLQIMKVVPESGQGWLVELARYKSGLGAPAVPKEERARRLRKYKTVKLPQTTWVIESHTARPLPRRLEIGPIVEQKEVRAGIDSDHPIRGPRIHHRDLPHFDLRGSFYLEADGRQVWTYPTGKSGYFARCGPIYSRARTMEAYAVDPLKRRFKRHPTETVIVFVPRVLSVKERAATRPLPYFPFTRKRREDDYLYNPKLGQAHVVRGQIYLPHHYKGKNQSAIVRLGAAAGPSSRTALVQGLVTRVYLAGRPAWLAGRDFFSVDGKKRLARLPASYTLPRNGRHRFLFGRRETLLLEKDGVHRYRGHRGWQLITYDEMRIPKAQSYFGAAVGSRGTLVHRYTPAAVVGSEAWMHDSGWGALSGGKLPKTVDFRTVSLDRYGAGLKKVSVTPVRSTGFPASWEWWSADRQMIVFWTRRRVVVMPNHWRSYFEHIIGWTRVFASQGNLLSHD